MSAVGLRMLACVTGYVVSEVRRHITRFVGKAEIQYLQLPGNVPGPPTILKQSACDTGYGPLAVDVPVAGGRTGALAEAVQTLVLRRNQGRLWTL